MTGGAGFLGSHLCDRLVGRGDEVVCVDNLVTGSLDNVAQLRSSARFRFVRHDVSAFVGLDGPLDAVMHLASPASPRAYLEMPIQTLKVCALGTHNCLGLARSKGARLVMASTSEVYGDPEVHPQVESYWGKVNPIGPRSVYDEGKRFAEAMTMAYHRTHGVGVSIARIFNTYGPRLAPGDGRVVSTFLAQALAGEPLTIYGTGSQTRSFCYVDDLVGGLVALLDSGCTGPVNLGNPEEHTMVELAEEVLAVTGSASRIVFGPLPADDPVRRRPDLSLAASLLGWQPRTELAEGLARTARWLSARLAFRA